MKKLLLSAAMAATVALSPSPVRADHAHAAPSSERACDVCPAESDAAAPAPIATGQQERACDVCPTEREAAASQGTYLQSQP